MSQKNIDFMKKNSYQFKKTVTTPNDQEVVTSVQRLLLGQIDATDTIVDADMPAKMLGSTLYWADGTPNDTNVKINKNGTIARKNVANDIIEQIIDLTGEYPSGITHGTDELISMCIYDNKLIVGSIIGEIIYYDFETTKWTTDGTGLSNDGSANGMSYPAYSMIEYQGNLIVGSASGRMAYYDGASWHNYDSGYTFCSIGNILGGTIYSMIEYNGNLIIAGGNGRVASYDGSNWKNYDGTGTGTGIYYDGLIGTIWTSIIYNNMLIFAGSSGEVASYDGSYWKDRYGVGTGIGPYGDSITSFNITSAIIYNNTLVVADDGGYVSSYDGTNWKLWNSTGIGTGIYRQFSGGYAIKSMIEYDNKLFFFHEGATAEQGKVDTYDGTTWVENDTEYFNNVLFFNETDANSQMRKVLLYNNIMYLISKDSMVQSFKKENGTVNLYNGNPTTIDFINQSIPNKLTLGSYSGSNAIYSIAEYGGYYVFAGENGFVSSYHITNKTWHTVDSNNGGIVNDGSSMVFSTGNKTIYTIVEFNGDLLFAAGNGLISSYDGSDWKYYDGSGTGTGPYNDGTAIGGEIYCSLEYNNGGSVIFAGFQGRITTWDGNGWLYYDGTWDGTGVPSPDSFCNDGVSTSGNFNIFSIINVNNTYVFGCEGGRIFNYNAPSFTNYDDPGTGNQPYNDGSLLGITEANVVASSSTEFFVTDRMSQNVAAWDSIGGWKNADGTGTGLSNIYYSGESILGTEMIISFACAYQGGIFITGKRLGGDAQGAIATCNSEGTWA